MSTERVVFAVSELIQYVNQIFEHRIQHITVQGELSGVKQATSGHYYLRLKDQQAVLDAVLFRAKAALLDFPLKNGVEVLCRGTLTVYAPQGRMQLVIEEVDLVGVGALAIAFQKLFSRLTQEGLFHPERKKPIPRLPRKIALITSPTGAALRDLLHVIRRRNPSCSLLLATCQVQGIGAAEQIVAMIEMVNRFPEVELIILGRGGGSIEDLWPFNEEIVARAIAASTIPILTGIGHETDFTIADFVADQRAPTPSAAAEIAVPEIHEWHKQIDEFRSRLITQIQHVLKAHRFQLENLQARIRPPQLQAERSRRTLEQLQKRLLQNLQQNIQRLQQHQQGLQRRLEARSPLALLAEYKNRNVTLFHQLRHHIHVRLQQQHHRLEQLRQRLHDLSPLHVLERGYALVYHNDRQLLRELRQVSPGDTLYIQLQQGQIKVVVQEITDNTPSDPRFHDE